MDPVSLAILGASLPSALTFLFDRANKVLDERATRRRSADGDEAIQPTPDVVQAPGLLQGELAPLTADPGAVEERQAELAGIVGLLSPYARNPDLIDENDPELPTLVGRLRGLLEEVYGQRITFVGEDREPSGGAVRVNQVIDEHSGNLTGIGRISKETSKAVEVDQRIGRTQSGSEVTGVSEIS
ncbi:hypothetical protein GCM10022206_58270 [Streptomyces chiangmaiensis]